jgi:hypothetical protein
VVIDHLRHAVIEPGKARWGPVSGQGDGIKPERIKAAPLPDVVGHDCQKVGLGDVREPGPPSPADLG